MALDFDTPVQQALKAVRERLTAQLVEVNGGDFDGVKIATRRAIDEAFDEPLPTPAANGAEVTTPARVQVTALCPSCGQPTAVSVTLEAQLVVTRSGRTIRLGKASKPAFHTCGQAALPVAGDPTLGLDESRCTCALGGADAERDEWVTTIEDCAVHGTAATGDGTAASEAICCCEVGNGPEKAECARIACPAHGIQEDISTPVAIEGELLTEHEDSDALLPA